MPIALQRLFSLNPPSSEGGSCLSRATAGRHGGKIGNKGAGDPLFRDDFPWIAGVANQFLTKNKGRKRSKERTSGVAPLWQVIRTDCQWREGCHELKES